MTFEYHQQYVIKTKHGSYVGLHSNSMELNYYSTDLNHAPKLSVAEVHFIYSRFNLDWQKNGFQAHEIVLSQTPVKITDVN